MPLDFPSSPTNGQQYQGYVYDATRQVWSHFDYLSGTSLLGTIYAWPLEDIPSWALELNGQAVSRTTYSGLFALLGTTYGAGDGTTTFNLPDYRGRTLVGHDTSQTEFDFVGEAGGAKSNTVSTSNLPSNLVIDANTSNTDTSFALKFSLAPAYGAKSLNQLGLPAGNPLNNLQPYRVVKWIICATTSAGEFDTEVQTALVARSSQTPLSPNFILNADFNIWQRGTSVAPTSTQRYSADRWESYRGAFDAGLTCSQQTTAQLPGFTSAGVPHLRAKRNAGNTSVQPIIIAQPMETSYSELLAGRTVTLSFYARRGATFSAASNLLNVALVTGTGTDQNTSSGFTGQATAINTAVTLNTTWQRYSFTATLASSISQVAPYFFYTPTGTAGATDNFDLAMVQLELGDAVTPFRTNSPNPQAELAACQRYYEVSVSSGAIAQYVGTGVAYTAGSMYAMLPFKVEKRIVPAAVISNGTNFWGFDRAGAVDQFSTLQAATSPQTTRQLGVVFANAELAGTAGQSGILMTQNAGASLAWNAEL